MNNTEAMAKLKEIRIAISQINKEYGSVETEDELTRLHHRFNTEKQRLKALKKELRKGISAELKEIK